MITSPQDTTTATRWSTKRILAEIKAQRGERVANHFETPIARLMNNLISCAQEGTVQFLDIEVPQSSYMQIKGRGYVSNTISADIACNIVEAAIRKHDQEKEFNDTWMGMAELAESFNITKSKAEHILHSLRRQHEESPPRETLSHGVITIPRSSLMICKTRHNNDRVMIKRSEINRLGNEITALDGTAPVTVNLNPKSENGIGKPR